MVKYQKYQLPRLEYLETSYVSQFLPVANLNQVDATYISWIYQETDGLQEIHFYQPYSLIYRRRYYPLDFFPYVLSNQQSQSLANVIQHLQLAVLSCSQDYWPADSTAAQNSNFQQRLIKRKQNKLLWEGTQFLYMAQNLLNPTSNLIHSGAASRNHTLLNIFWEQACLTKEKQK